MQNDNVFSPCRSFSREIKPTKISFFSHPGSDPSAAANTILDRIRSIGPPELDASFPIFRGSPSHVESDGVPFDIPSTTDVWFIHVGITILPPWSYAVQGDWYINEKRSAKVKELVAPVLQAAGGVGLMRCPRNQSDLSSFVNNGIETIKEARFECMDGMSSFRWPSRGPMKANKDGVNPSSAFDEICAYIAFPVGPIGPAIKTISLVVDKITDEMKEQEPWSDKQTCKQIESGDVDGGLFPPLAENNDCYGLHLVEDHHSFMSEFLEYPAQDFHGLPRHLSHQWLRFYFKKTSTYPVPGKFVGIIIKPQSAVCWWYQKTSPLMYSGAFFETRYYTSGKITKILKESEKKHKEIGNVYVVNIRGVDIHIQSSDFLKYSVDDEVCVLKKPISGFSGIPKEASSWLDMDDLDFLLESLGDNPATGVYTLVRDYVIVPISFYSQEGDKDGKLP